MNHIRGIETDCEAITVYFPDYEGSTEGPYYSLKYLANSDGLRMRGLMKSRKSHAIRRWLTISTALVLWLCSLL